MSSLTTPDGLAIRLSNVSKIYRLHGSQADQLIDVLGLQKFGIKPKKPAKEFSALSNISLEVPRGHRIGIVGRNGAGKTTLLKLICGNFSPTQGDIEVNGHVQALMSVGLGFHPEYTGRENVAAALQYNGLNRSEYQEAVEGIIEFCELGEFLDQPFKSYSLGMQARLMFAAATAIKPDILIVDEVLGAGDAYFVAKSKARVERMIHDGCTMLLVSHSMQQVLELCDEAIWLEHGTIKMRGDALLVVKAYEESLHGSIKGVALQLREQPEEIAEEVLPDSIEDEAASLDQLPEFPDASKNNELFPKPDALTLQIPHFLPHQIAPQFPSYRARDMCTLRHVARGGISRWKSEVGVKVTGFSIQTERGVENRLRTLRPIKLILTLTAEHSGDFSCMYGIIFNHLDGSIAARIWSPPDEFLIGEGDSKLVEMILNPLQLGPGEYTIGVTVLKATSIELVNGATRYDQLGRSFGCVVEMDESQLTASAEFMHSAEWAFHPESLN
jgi:lipopolysaccharide transport system ATP-binding protein